MPNPKRRNPEDEYLSPKEILEWFPELHNKYGWTANDIGNLLRMKLVTGFSNKTKGINMVKVGSVKPLIEVVNSNLDGMKIKF